jgi:hypothetical protein
VGVVAAPVIVVEMVVEEEEEVVVVGVVVVVVVVGVLHPLSSSGLTVGLLCRRRPAAPVVVVTEVGKVAVSKVMAVVVLTHPPVVVQGGPIQRKFERDQLSRPKPPVRQIWMGSNFV